MRILIVDDSELQRRSLKALLEEQGYKDVVLADSASEALAVLASLGQVDLILLDFVMPDINGLEACRLIRDHLQYRDIPIIFVTAKSDIESLQEAFEAGAIDFLAKPPHRVELGARVRSALSLKEERDRRKARERKLLELTQKLSEANKMLRRLAVVDGLTGVANRRYFDEALAEEWRRAKRDRLALSLIMIDIDHFKLYNDHFGHQGGDDCLKAVAAALAQNLHRSGDLVARYGGEEFAAILPHTEPQGAVEVAEFMRQGVERLTLPHPKSPVGDRVTVSLGVASLLPDSEEPAEVLVAKADAALYQAKKAGRNRTVAAD